MLSLLRTVASLARPQPQWSAPSLLQTGLRPNLSALRSFHASPPSLMTLNQSMRSKHPPKKRARATAPLLNNCPQRKGMAMQIFIMSPKKPNSAKRKVARVKLTNGNVVHAYINGEGNLMHDHAIVLVRGGRAQDLPGVRYKVVRGVYDHPSVVGRLTARSKYGVKKKE